MAEVHSALQRVLALGGGLFQDEPAAGDAAQATTTAPAAGNDGSNEHDKPPKAASSLGGPKALPLTNAAGGGCDYETIFRTVVLALHQDGGADDMVWFVKAERTPPAAVGAATPTDGKDAAPAGAATTPEGGDADADADADAGASPPPPTSPRSPGMGAAKGSMTKAMSKVVSKVASPRTDAGHPEADGSMNSDLSDLEDAVFIRRRTLPDSFPPPHLVDWRASVFLNIVCQLEFELSVAVCRGHIEGREDNFAMNWVQRRVYASPSSPDSMDKEGLFRCTWPHVFFTVDDFKEAFSDMALDEGLWCVELVTFDCARARIPVFRGALTYERLFTEYERKTSRGVLPKNPFSRRGPETVFNLRGPGGRGAAQATVTKEGKQLHCCLANVSAVWVDIVHCLEHPVTKDWLHIPTPEEQEEEAEYLRSLSGSSTPSPTRRESAMAKASQTAKAAQQSASKFLGGLRSTLSARGKFRRGRDDEASTPEVSPDAESGK